jgi:hypothetical protein
VGDILSGGTLLLPRRCEGRVDFVDLADGLADALDGIRRVPGGELNDASLAADLLAVWLVRFLTAVAATAKPLLALLARAALIVGLRASRLG